MNKTSKLNLILLAILIIAGLGVWQFKKRNNLENKPQNKTAVSFLQISKDQIEAVEISQNGKTEKLKKTEKGWMVLQEQGNDQGAIEVEADLDKISNLLKVLEGLGTVELASNNLEKLETFGLDEKNAIKLKIELEGSQGAKEILVGKDNFSRVGTYLKWPDENNIYLSKEVLSMSLQVADWRNLKIVQFDKDKLNKVSFDYKNQTDFALIKEDGKWTVEGQSESKAEEIENFLSGLSALSGDDLVFGQSEAELKLDPPFLKINLTGENEASEILIGDKIPEGEQEYYYILSQGKIFKTAQYKVQDSLLKAAKDFE